MTLMERLRLIYPDDYSSVTERIEALITTWHPKLNRMYKPLSEKDVVLITYADAINAHNMNPLEALDVFLKDILKEAISVVHLLPMYPFTSDDGFSVTDYYEINPEFGDWRHVERLAESFDLMFDVVLNHCSKESVYFKSFLENECHYKDFFIKKNEGDYSKVIRPRVSPLFTAFPTPEGDIEVWTTFSDDQVDFNFRNPNVLIKMIDVILFYLSKGARFLRFDAVGFIWKASQTTCMHLPETHEIIKIIRHVVDACVPGVKIITETNVKHHENISYFGNGRDEASMVYQFALPPLVLHTLLTHSTKAMNAWLGHLFLPSESVTYFNFLSSHDGIGLRAVEDILSENEIANLIESVTHQGGKINYRKLDDGRSIPYELCISFLDALSDDFESEDMEIQKFLAAHAILLSLQGVPAIYYNSVMGMRNDDLAVKTTGIHRRINRKKHILSALVETLSRS
ncbi:MAG: sugar phosphorylase [Acholeplasmataceae bacterium]|nr:sugar phosphorylase [Acholeplasmataceae bacterium]